MASETSKDYIDLRDVWHRIVGHKKLFLKVWVVTFVLACAWILPVPRTYVSECMLAPETENPASGGALSSLASSFGINMGAMNSSDAFYPMLYPDIMGTNDFIVGLLDIPVTTADGELHTDYFTYMTQHQQKTFYKLPLLWLSKQIKSLFPKPEKKGGGSGDGRINPHYLSEEQDQLIKGLQEVIRCSVDKKTEVITITVVDQDPLIAATMADSVRVRLQNFITNYRTSKARIDMEHYERLVAEAKSAYDASVAEYGAFADTHRNASLTSVIARQEELNNEMQVRFATYNAMNTQLEAAKAKVQERTPAFTVLQAASVPVRPAKPKRMIFVAAMLFLATLGVVAHLFWQDVKEQLLRGAAGSV